MSWTVYNSSGQLLQATDLPDDVVGVAELSATGTASSSTFLRGDNAWAAPAGGPTEATQADMEDSGTSNANRYVSPEVAKYHPGIAKAWGVVTAAGANRSPVYNLDANGDTGTGDRLIQFTVAFSSTVYAGSAQVAGDDANQIFALLAFPGSVDEIRCTTRQATDPGTSTTTLTDHGVAVAFFGDQ